VSPPISSELIDTSPEPTLRQEEEIVKANRGNDRWDQFSQGRVDRKVSLQEVNATE